MKVIIKLVIILGSTLLTNSADAQSLFSKGRSLVRFSASYFNSEDNTQSTGGQSSFNQTGYSLRPGYGYFMKDNLLIGLSAFFENSSSETGSPLIETQERRFSGFRLFTEKYFQIHGNFGVYLEPFVQFDWQRRELADLNAPVETVLEDRFSRQIVAVNLGVYYAIKDRFLVDVTVGQLAFSSTRLRDTDQTSFFFTDFSQKRLNFFLVNSIGFDELLRFNFLF